jgi:hypothetical protein
MKTNVSDFFHSNTALSKELIVLLFVLQIFRPVEIMD